MLKDVSSKIVLMSVETDKKIYAGARIANPHDAFFVCWFDPVTRETGWVRDEYGDEYGDDWAEAYEIAYWFNTEHDGCLYFVGDSNWQPIRPSYKEAHQLIQFEYAFATKYHRPMAFDYSEKMVLEVLFGGWL